MKKVLVVFGTRPEAIKMAPLIKHLQSKSCFETRICITAQHREILDQILAMFEISTDYDLNVMAKGQDLFHITSKVLSGMKDVLEKFKPDLVLVHGDTTTTFAASLACFYLRIDVGHVEAGLRTNNIYSPYPEEINRQFATKLAKFHFAPTLLNKENLLKENVREENIVVTGNTVIDALLMTVERIKGNPALDKKLKKTIHDIGYGMDRIDSGRKLILVTGHRRENFGLGFLNICEALKQIALAHPETDILYPVHMNPNVRRPVHNVLSGIENVFLIEPVDYEVFVYLMERSYLILTDSGGIQEEAPALGKPALVMRDTTERPEAVSAGTIALVGVDQSKIIKNTEILLNDQGAYEKMSRAVNPYGDGKASEKIVEFMINIFH